MQLVTTVYISYSRAQAQLVEQFKRDLYRNGVRIWAAHENYPPGTRGWEDAVRTGMQSVDVVLYMASPEARQARSVAAELNLARLARRPVIPVWVAGDHVLQVVPPVMTNMQYIDARFDYRTALTTLLASFRQESRPSNPLFTPETLPSTPNLGGAPRRRGGRGLGVGISLAVVVVLAFSALAVSFRAGLFHIGSSTTPAAAVKCTPTDGIDTSTLKLVSAGKLTLATDASYPPQEFVDPTSNDIVGLEPDLMKELAKRLCLTPVITNVRFNSILPGITASTPGNQYYDMSLSAFTINATRLKQVDMIPYITAGESLLVPSGNPKHIKTKNDLCGLAVAVEAGTVEEAEIKLVQGSSTPPVLNGAGGACANKPVKLQSFGDEDQVIQALQSGKVDATYQDSPVSGYYNSKNGNTFTEVTTVAPTPEGIVVRKDNAPFEDAIKATLIAMESDGTYDKILTSWGLINSTCKFGSPCAAATPIP